MLPYFMTISHLEWSNSRLVLLNTASKDLLTFSDLGVTFDLVLSALSFYMNSMIISIQVVGRIMTVLVRSLHPPHQCSHYSKSLCLDNQSCMTEST